MKTIEHDLTFGAGSLGFTLVEIVVAVTVIALMTTALFSFISFAGDSWQRGHMTINLIQEGNALLDYLESELALATKVLVPTLGNSDIGLVYIKIVSDYQPSPSFQPFDFSIKFLPDDNLVFSMLLTTGTTWTNAVAATWGISTTGGVKKIIPARYNFDLARHVVDFQINRPEFKLFVVRLKLKAIRARDGFDKEIELTRTILAPQVL